METKFFFDEKTHTGGYGNEIYPSVTQLLRKFNLINFDGVDNARLEYKRQIGTVTHKAIQLLNACNLDLDHFEKNCSSCMPYLNAYIKFREIEKFEVLHSELRMFSRKRKFHGAVDMIATDEYGRICLIDYKCTWRLYESVGSQLSGYEILLKENFKELGFTPQQVKRKIRRFALQLKETGNYELKEYTDKMEEQDFLACVWLWWRRINKYSTNKPEDITNE